MPKRKFPIKKVRNSQRYTNYPIPSTRSANVPIPEVEASPLHDYNFVSSTRPIPTDLTDVLYIIITSVKSVGIGLVEDTTSMEVDIVGQEDATYLERGMGAVGIGQQDENEVEQVLFDRMWQDLQIGSDHSTPVISYV